MSSSASPTSSACATNQVAAAVDLLDGGSTVPFIARYRKEATGALDDAQLRTLEERLGYLRELEERRTAVLEEIRKQGKLDEALEERIRAAESKARLEDIYLPVQAQAAHQGDDRPRGRARAAGRHPARPTRRRTRQDGRGRLRHRARSPTPRAGAGGRPGDPGRAVRRGRRPDRRAARADVDAAAGWSRRSARARRPRARKFADYFDFAEPFTTLPSHRILAVFRGEKEEVLDVALEPTAEPAEPGEATDYERTIAAAFGIADQGRPADKWLRDVVRWAWRTRILLHLGIDIRVRLRTVAEEGAIGVFATNLRDLLLAAPAGSRATMGLDPGLRTGVKVAVVDATGKVVATDTIYPHEPRRAWDAALATLTKLAAAHDVELVAIGNGTASRETDKLARELAARQPGAQARAGDGQRGGRLGVLGVGLRLGRAARPRRLAARRGVHRPPAAGPARRAGQDRPEVDRGRASTSTTCAESALSRSLDAVVEDCVNAVGVDVNTASAPLLRRVSGITEGLAGADRRPPRRQRPVPHPHGAGRRAAAGPEGVRAVRGLPAHPRRRRPAGRLRRAPRGLPGGAPDPGGREGRHRRADRQRQQAQVAASRRTSSTSGSGCRPSPTSSPSWRSPAATRARRSAPPPSPRACTRSPTCGRACCWRARSPTWPRSARSSTSGVHQDGLVHVSAMSTTFVSDPREVVKSGDVVRVKVLEVDEARKRISLTLRLDDEAGQRQGAGEAAARRPRGRRRQAAAARAGAQPAGQGGPPAEQRRVAVRAGRAAGVARAVVRRAAVRVGGMNSAMADALRRAGLDQTRVNPFRRGRPPAPLRDPSRHGDGSIVVEPADPPARPAEQLRRYGGPPMDADRPAQPVDPADPTARNAARPHRTRPAATSRTDRSRRLVRSLLAGRPGQVRADPAPARPAPARPARTRPGGCHRGAAQARPRPRVRPRRSVRRRRRPLLPAGAPAGRLTPSVASRPPGTGHRVSRPAAGPRLRSSAPAHGPLRRAVRPAARCLRAAASDPGVRSGTGDAAVRAGRGAGRGTAAAQPRQADRPDRRRVSCCSPPWAWVAGSCCARATSIPRSRRPRSSASPSRPTSWPPRTCAAPPTPSRSRAPRSPAPRRLSRSRSPTPSRRTTARARRCRCATTGPCWTRRRCRTRSCRARAPSSVSSRRTSRALLTSTTTRAPRSPARPRCRTSR